MRQVTKELLLVIKPNDNFLKIMCLYLSDENSLQLALNRIENFAVSSSLKLNRDKSEAIWIAASSNYLHKPSNGLTVLHH
jgi:hypothetical protein